MSIDFLEVGLTVNGREVSGNNYRRQFYAEQVRFGPAQPHGWGKVDGVFVTDSYQQRYPLKLDVVNARPGTVLTVDLDVIVS